MFDNFLFFKNRKKIPSFLKEDLKDFIFCTIHRSENTDNKNNFNKIYKLLNKLSKHKKIIFSVHPRTFNMFSSSLKNSLSKNILLSKPLSMFETFWALENCSFVVTDSGGLQKEAYFAKKKCITLREQTEWIELSDLKVNLLLSPSSTHKEEKINNFLASVPNFKKRPYGEGITSKKILSTIY